MSRPKLFHMGLKLKRAYDPPSKDDGCRILVDRLWPRGLRKGEARLECWLKEIAPSTGLRKWFGHDPARWEEFKKRYFAELDGRAALVEELRKRTEQGVVTLVYGAKDETHNHAAALKDYLRRRARFQPGELRPPTFPTQQLGAVGSGSAPRDA